jgi:hypothetical protein
VKRSRRIKLVLLGGLSAGAIAGCGPNAGGPPAVNTNGVYTNNLHIPGAGYYHAPFQRWYILPYNHFDPQTQRYFYGGQWGMEPHQSIINISSPTTEAVSHVATARTDVRRGGFGGISRGYSGSHGIYS